MEDGFKINIMSTEIITKCRDYPKAYGKVITSATESLELNANNFKTFAFGTHPPAYIDGGLGNISMSDLLKVGLTPDFKEWFGADSWVQLGEILRYLWHDKTTKLQEFPANLREEIKEAGIEVAESVVDKGINAVKRELNRRFDEIFRFPTIPSLF